MTRQLGLLLVIVIVLFVATPAFAQSRVDGLVARYEQLFQANRIAECEPIVAEAIELAKQSTPEHVAPMLLFHSNVLTLMEKPAEAERALQEASLYADRSPHKDKVRAFVGLGLGRLRAEQGQYDEAEKYMKSAIEQLRGIGGVESTIDLAISTLADCYENQGKYSQVEQLLLPLLPAARQSADPGQAVVQVLPLAHSCYSRGKYTEAERYFRDALDMSVRAYGWDHTCTAEIATAMSRVYMAQYRYNTAVRMLTYALPILERVHGDDHSFVAHTRTMLATCYGQLGKPVDELALREETIRILQRKYPDGHTILAEELGSLGYCYYLEGRSDEGEARLRAALAISTKVSGPDSTATAAILFRLARVLRDKKDWVQAEQLAKRSISLRAHADLAPAGRMESHQVLAEVQWETGRRVEALQSIETAMRLADEQRSWASGSETERATVFGSLTECFELGVHWYVETGDDSAAFGTIERMRARAFIDELGYSNSDLLEGRSEQERAKAMRQEADLRGRITFLEQKLNDLPSLKGDDASGRAAREQISNEISEARSQLFEHWRALRDSSPVYQELISTKQQFATVEQVRATLVGDQDLLLAYLVGSERSYVAVVSRGDSKMFPLEISASQAAVLGTTAGPLNHQRLQQALQNSEGTGAVQQLSRVEQAEAALPKLAALWPVLVPEQARARLLSGEIKHAVILPDGPLALLPFEVLVTELEAEPRYLLDSGPPLFYGPSATVLCNLAVRKPAAFDRARPVLSFGDPSYAAVASGGSLQRSGDSSTRMNLSPLPYSGQESRWVSRVFSDNGQPALQFLGAQATEGNVRSSLAGRRILHLACHGLSEKSYGNLFGALALAKGTDALSPDDDGMLTLAEIYDLDLAACELAILSACMTNYGPQQQGEGTWAISRGFLVGGARRVVASNWVVDDEAGASLVSYFCGAVAKAQGSGKPADYATCLHDAKRWVRNQSNWKSPFYWGTFELIGPQ